MKTKLIKLSYDHYIVVDDSEIKEGDSCYDYYTKSIQQSIPNVNDGNAEEYFKKITHSTNPLGFLQEKGFTTSNLKPDWSNVKELSLSEVEESINGYSVEKISQEHNKNISWGTVNKYSYQKQFELGFKAHQELVNDKLFTIEDMREAFFDVEYPHSEIDFQHLLARRGLKTVWDIEIDEQGKIKLT